MACVFVVEGEILGGFGADVSTAIEALIPELQEPCRDLVNLAGSAGVQPKITSTLRSRSEQVRLYNRYISGHSAYPAAPPGRSAHEFGYAFDMIVTGSDNQHDLGKVWLSWGGVYSLSDDIHFEYPGFTPPPIQQSPAEQIATLPLPLSVSLGQDLAQAFGADTIPQDVLYALLHPWTGLDWLVPQFLLDWRMKIFGI